MPSDRSRLGVQSLEGRDCPAVNFFNGVLTVTGTSGAESLVVTQSGATISTQGQTFNAASVTRVVVTGQGGNDVIQNNTAKPAHLFGGTGNDTIYGGSATDRLFGGQGADKLYGKLGNDYLFGGAGTDTLGGGGGTNALVQGSQDLQLGNTAMEQEIIRLVNVQRGLAGLPPLTVNLRLNSAASLHTQDMVSISNLYGPNVGMQHTLFGTPRPEVSDRLDTVGYDTWTTAFSWGENIAYGYTSAAAVMNAWMNSTGIARTY